MGLLEAVRDYLTSLGVVNTTTWKCYVGFLPDDQAQLVALYETGGFVSETLGRETEYPTFEVLVRSDRLEYSVVRAKWQQIFTALHDANQTGGSPDTLRGIYLIQALATGPLAFVDERERPNMTVNFKVVKKS